MGENKNLQGTITAFNTYHTDAYMIAVKNGFEGTEAEWLESLTSRVEEKASEAIVEAEQTIIRLSEASAEAVANVDDAEVKAVEHIESLAEQALNIVQTTGDSTTAVMSQKATTDICDEITKKLMRVEASPEINPSEVYAGGYTAGYMTYKGVINASSNMKYTDKIAVSAGDTFVTEGGELEGQMRYVAAFNGDTVVSASGAERTNEYTVPDGINYIVISIPQGYNNIVITRAEQGEPQESEYYYVATPEFFPEDLQIPRYEEKLGDIETILASIVEVE